MNALEMATTPELVQELSTRFDALVFGGYKQLDPKRYHLIPLYKGNHPLIKGMIMTLMDQVRVHEGMTNGFGPPQEPDEPEFGPI